MRLSVLEICAGAGGQALGLEIAGFDHVAAIEIDPAACATLLRNRPAWFVIQQDIRQIDGKAWRGVDLLAGGVPCPPFSIAGKQLGSDDERDLFPEALRLVEEAQPAAVMLENVRGFAADRFKAYRKTLLVAFDRMGYDADWRVFNASDFGVPQLRPRFVLVALRRPYSKQFMWPEPAPVTVTIGDALFDLMASEGWPGAPAWRLRARGIAPTLVGGSRKHGGPDLGPTRARNQWAQLGVDGLGLADAPPDADFPVDGLPRLTLRMVARLQGFPDSWSFTGKKTPAYRQIGNAFPPPVSAAVGRSIYRALAGQIAEKRPQEQLQLFGPEVAAAV